MQNNTEQTPAGKISEATEKVKGKAEEVAGKTKHLWSNLIKGEKIIIIGALASLLAFFLPWFSMSEKYINGPKAGSDVGYIYLLPLSMIISLALIYFTQGATTNRKILMARWQIVIGTLWGSIFIFSMTAIHSIVNILQEAMGGFGSFFGIKSLGVNICFGAFLLAVGAIMIVIGAFKAQSEFLKHNKDN